MEVLGTPAARLLGFIRIGWALVFAAGFASIYGVTWVVAECTTPTGSLPEWSRVLRPHEAIATIGLVIFPLVWGWLAFESMTRMDPGRLATRNFGWSARSLLRAGSIVSAALFHASWVGAFWAIDNIWPTLGHRLEFFYAAVAIPLLWALLVPLAVAQESVVAPPQPSSAWRLWLPHRPTFATLYAAFQLSFLAGAILLLGAFLETRVTAIPESSEARSAVAAVLAIPSFLVFPCVPAIAAAILFHSTSGPAFRRWLGYYRWRRFGPLLAFQARLTLCSFFVSASSLAVRLLRYTVIPEIAWHSSEEPPTLFWTRHLVRTIEVIDSWIWLCVLPFLWIFCWLSAARFAWQLESQNGTTQT